MRGIGSRMGRSFTFLCLVLLSTTNGSSQVSNSIEVIKNRYQATFEVQKSKAIEYASKHAIPISRNTLEGNHLLLVDVVEGIPVFLSTLNSGAATTTGVSKIQGGVSGLNLMGLGMLIGVWDAGSVNNHSEFDSRIISKEVNEDDSHATHVSGTIIASGINPNAKGMAPKATITNWYFDNDLAEMTALAKPDESSILFSNHSYGTVTGWTKVNGSWSWTGNSSVSPDEDFRFGLYGIKASSLDQLANLAPYYTIVWAAGNDRGEPGDGSRPPDCNGGSGYDCIIPEGVAKNIITVGAVNKVNTYSGPSSVVMSSFSSWGPTDDGRIKPDVVSAGVNLLSTSAVGVDTYELRSGTSMATPNVVGSLALIQELYKKLHGGVVMKSATLKALTIHTAKEAGLLPGPDYSFGWGLLDVDAAARLLAIEDGVNNVVEEIVLNNGTDFEKIINPLANQKITATIVWNDPAAPPTPSALDPQSLMLINDLDIKLLADNGTEHYPWLLDPAAPTAQAIKGNNYRDNVEKLEFNLPEAKPYRLIVSHKGQLLGGSQAFSLILSYKSSVSNAKTLYWVGDSGSWGDNTHWSLTSGGTPAFVIPGEKDRIIVDENSFDGVGLDQISILENRSVESIKWLRSTSANLDLQGNTLSVKKELSIADASFATTGTGVIKCTTTPSLSGNIYFTNIDFGSTQLLVDGGGWSLRGNFISDQLELTSGKLTIISSKLNLKRLNATSSPMKELILNNSEIRISEQSNLVGNSILIEASNSKLILDMGSPVLNWDDADFNGTVEIATSGVSLLGNILINHLKFSPGTSTILGDGSVLKIDSLSGFEGLSGNLISLSSSTKSRIELSNHFLLCTDYLNISNVDLAGQAIINVGENSTLTNSLNWFSQPCETVLFADFNEAYLCQNGFTEFIDKSVGEVTSWTWDFGDELSAVNTSETQNPFHGFENAGVYQVQLSISDGQSSHSYSKEVIIQPSLMDQIQIAVNANDLISLAISSSYQWFLNEQKIEGATARSFTYNGAEGVYRVVTKNGECNLSSRLVTITGFEEDHQISFFPNPASDILNVGGIYSESYISLRDVVGKIVFEARVSKDFIIPLNPLSSGMYLLQIKNKSATLIRKIVVKR